MVTGYRSDYTIKVFFYISCAYLVNIVLVVGFLTVLKGRAIAQMSRKQILSFFTAAHDSIWHYTFPLYFIWGVEYWFLSTTSYENEINSYVSFDQQTTA